MNKLNVVYNQNYDIPLPSGHRFVGTKFSDLYNFIKDSNLRSVTQTLKDYKNKEFYKRGNDKLIRNYGIGAQIIKDLKLKI